MLNFRNDVQRLYHSGSLQGFLDLPFSPGSYDSRRSPPVVVKESLSRAPDARRHLPLLPEADDDVQGRNALASDPPEVDGTDSRYGLGNNRREQQTSRGTFVFVSDEGEDEDVSDMSVSPPAGASGKKMRQATGAGIDRDARHAYWSSKGGPGGNEDAGG